MYTRLNGLWLAGLGLLLAACGSAKEEDSAGLDHWLGSTRHLRVLGTINGESLDIDISGDAAKDTTQLWCEREYQVPSDTAGNFDYTKAYNTEVRIKGPVVVGGEMRQIDVQFKRHNFQADHAGAVIDAIPRDDNHSPCGLNAAGSTPECIDPVGWLSFAWRPLDGGSPTFKAAAQSGSMTIGEFVGTPDPAAGKGNIIPDGTGNVGGYATGQWSPTEALKISFDANCTMNQIDNKY